MKNYSFTDVEALMVMDALRRRVHSISSTLLNQAKHPGGPKDQGKEKIDLRNQRDVCVGSIKTIENTLYSLPSCDEDEDERQDN